MTATYTFDVYSTLDGFGSYNEHGDWGGYWGKEGPEFLAHRLDVYSQTQRFVLGAHTFQQFIELIGPETGMIKVTDPVNIALRNIPATVVSTRLKGPFDWPDATVVSEDAVDVVRRLKAESSVPLRSHGSLAMNRAVLAAGLVDRIQLTIFPALSGKSGIAPVLQGTTDFDLELIESRTFDGGIQELIYRPTVRSR